MKATLIDTRVQGPVVIDSSARLAATIVRGPAVIESGARLRDAYVGPYTSIRPNVRLEGAEVEHSIVQSDASTATSPAASSPVWSVPRREAQGLPGAEGTSPEHRRGRHDSLA